MNQLIEFSLDTENANKNYKLAEWYRKQGHLSPAHTYYLRAAERTKDNNLAYKCLLNSAECYHRGGKIGERETTRRYILENAITLLPERPEAYLYLCFYYELKKDWTNCYKHACIGLYQCSKVDLNLFSGFDQDWEALLLYIKAISAWWCGRGMESRKLFRMLAFNYWDRLSREYQISVENNFMRLGVGSFSQGIKPYTKNNFDKLRYKFRDAEKIEKNYSQVFQDMFVLSMLDGKKDGTFLEIGGSKPFENNNTALLEQEFGWGGVSIEWNESFVQEYKQNRPTTKILCSNALEIDYELLLLENYEDSIIDYLQLDIEPSKNTYECLLKIPFDKYKFRVITYEHDHYIDITQTYREKSRKYLSDKGYKLIANDISPDGESTFEDWWVHPDLVDQNIIEKMTLITENPKMIDYYMLPNNYYAEYETDRYIRENFFPDFLYKGVMVDVGAGPPSFISNSKHFRDCGWRTICIEPNPKFVKQHQDAKSEIYQYACSNEEKETSFIINYNNDEWYSENNDGVSFSSLEIRYKNIPNHNTQEIIQVETIKLDTLLENLNINKIDILSIDVEGWEIDVLMGFNSNKYNPKVIVIENLESNKNYEKYMNEINYYLSAKLGCNEIYVKL
jgi:FkbM family methyltransferase